MMRKAFKYALITLGIIAVCLSLFAAALPSLISTKWGNEIVVKTINSNIKPNLSVAIERLELSWLGGQSIDGVKLEANDELILSLERIATKQTLWNLLIGNMAPEPSELIALNLYSPTQPNEKNAIPFLQLLDVNGSIEALPDGKWMRTKLTGKTLEGTLHGQFDLEGTAPRPQQIGEAPIDIIASQKVKIQNFPVAIIDLLAGMQNPNLRGFFLSLLGPSLSATIEGTQQGSTIWDIRTPNLSCSFNSHLDSTHFSLTQPAKAEVTITPDLISNLIEKNSTLPPLSLEQPANLVIWIHDLVIPLENNYPAISQNEIVLNLKFDLSKLTFKGIPLFPSFVIDQIQGELAAPKNAPDASLHILGIANKKSENFKIKFDSIFQKPKTLEAPLEDLLQNIKNNAKFHVETSGFPMTLLDRFAHAGSFYTDLFGNTINLYGDLQITQGSGDGVLGVSSDKVNVKRTSFHIGKQSLILAEPAKVNYLLSSAVAQNYLFENVPLELISDVHLQLSVKALEIPLSLADQKLHLDAELIALNEAIINGGASLGTVSIENGRAALSGKSTEELNCELTAELASPKNSGVFSDLIGADTQVRLSCKMGLLPDLNVVCRNINAAAVGSKLKASLTGSYDNGNVELSAPATLQLLLSPQLIAKARLHEVLPTQLEKLDKPAFVYLTIPPPSKAWNIEKPDHLEITGNLSSDPLSFAIDDGTFELLDLMVPWEFNGEDQKLKLSFSGKAHHPPMEQMGTFRGKCVIKEAFFDKHAPQDEAEYKFRCSLVDFPGGLLGFISQKPEIPEMMGHIINAEVDIQTSPGKDSGHFDLVVHGDQFDLQAAMIFSDKLMLKDPNQSAHLSMLVTPERFEILDKAWRMNDDSSPLVLKDPTHLTASIDYIKLPWKSSFPYWHAGIKGKFSLDKMIMLDKKRNYEVPFQQIDGEILTDDLADSITLNLHTVPSQTANHSGTLDFYASIQDAFTKSGEINFKNLSLNLAGTARNLYTHAFCRLFCPFPTMADKVEALLGDPLNADIKADIVQMTGPIKADMQGTLGKAQLDGQLANGTLTLNAPFVAQVEATPKLGEYILHDIAPFLSSLKKSSHPLQIIIDPEGFSFPVLYFNRKQINIERCSFSAGKMLFDNSGQMKSILGLLSVSGQDEIPIWVTPLYLTMRDGLIHLYRVDMLLNNYYPIAAWGNVDIVKEKVNMIIAITGTAIRNALKLDNIDPSFMLQLPFKGPLDNPKLDKKKAAAKISAFALAGKAAQGSVLGSVLDIASGGFKENKPPPPTTTPLPWEGQSMRD